MTDALHLSGVSVALGGRLILHEIELSLANGELAALIGPNGSGKSTLLSTIAGLKRPEAGAIRVSGHSMAGDKRRAREALGYMVAQDRLPGLLTPRQCLALFARGRGFEQVPALTFEQCEDLGLTPWMDRWLMSCSLGTRQKVSVVLALLGSPAVILLDEPLNGLDPVSALALKGWLAKLTQDLGSTVLMATHDLAVVESLHDHVIVMLEGRILLDWDRDRLARELAEPGDGLEVRVARALSDSN